MSVDETLRMTSQKAYLKAQNPFFCAENDLA